MIKRTSSTIKRTKVSSYRLQPSISEQILTPDVRAYMKSLAQDKSKAVAFLKKHGFMDENNQLAEIYR